MNAIVHAFKTSVGHASARPWALARAWQWRGALLVVVMVVISALALVTVKDTNRRLLADVEEARVSLEAQRLDVQQASLLQGQAFRPDVLQARAAAMGMVVPQKVNFLRVSSSR